MKVLILGCGVVGTTTAWHLLRDGHEVTVLDREPPAQGGASFGNAGLIAPGHSFAWASPKAVRTLFKSLYRDDQAFQMKFPPDARLLRWGLQFLGQCTTAAARRNTLVKHQLCAYSQQVLHEVVQETGIAYDRKTGGLLYLHRSPETLKAGAGNMRILEEDGQAVEVVDPDRAAEVDPALKPVRDRFAGGIYIPADESGDSRIFTEKLVSVCQSLGGEFVIGPEIQRIEANGDRVERVVTNQGDHTADLYLLCLGCWSPLVARTLGVHLSVYPVKGYSVTLPLKKGGLAPKIGGVDEDHLLAYAPMGNRMRLTSIAEFAGYDRSHAPDDFAPMIEKAKTLFPEACEYDQPQYWAGLRPMTPEGTPIIGKGRHQNLIYNTGHGHMGWTMSCGAARITADVVSGRTPEFDISGMGVR